MCNFWRVCRMCCWWMKGCKQKCVCFVRLDMDVSALANMMLLILGPLKWHNGFRRWVLEQIPKKVSQTLNWMVMYLNKYFSTQRVKSFYCFTLFEWMLVFSTNDLIVLTCSMVSSRFTLTTNTFVQIFGWRTNHCRMFLLLFFSSVTCLSLFDSFFFSFSVVIIFFNLVFSSSFGLKSIKADDWWYSVEVTICWIDKTYKSVAFMVKNAMNVPHFLRLRLFFSGA